MMTVPPGSSPPRLPPIATSFSNSDNRTTGPRNSIPSSNTTYSFGPRTPGPNYLAGNIANRFLTLTPLPTHSDNSNIREGSPATGAMSDLPRDRTSSGAATSTSHARQSSSYVRQNTSDFQRTHATVSRYTRNGTSNATDQAPSGVSWTTSTTGSSTIQATTITLNSSSSGGSTANGGNYQGGRTDRGYGSSSISRNRSTIGSNTVPTSTTSRNTSTPSRSSTLPTSTTSGNRSSTASSNRLVHDQLGKRPPAPLYQNVPPPPPQYEDVFPPPEYNNEIPLPPRRRRRTIHRLRSFWP
ncbi:MAG: hypothetical protein M1831_002264 [Alyxoria varia]|nr:MAG: hypothetical protein M1831_002264 [Alyxoria varia]